MSEKTKVTDECKTCCHFSNGYCGFLSDVGTEFGKDCIAYIEDEH